MMKTSNSSMSNRAVIVRSNLGKFVAFMLMGLPGFAVAIVINSLLVLHFSVPIWLAYAIALAFQMKLNFYLVHRFVFKLDENKGYLRAFIEFLYGALFLRLTDWLVYLLWVHLMNLNIVAAQLINVVVFSILRYWYTKRIFNKE